MISLNDEEFFPTQVEWNSLHNEPLVNEQKSLLSSEGRQEEEKGKEMTQLDTEYQTRIQHQDSLHSKFEREKEITK